MRPFKFYADAREIVDGRELAERARRAEAIGYHGLVIPDHLIPQLAPIPAMACVAAATTRLRIGTFVLNNAFRHPAVVAQDLASLDVLSGGRLDVALGAGWNKPSTTPSAFRSPVFENARRSSSRRWRDKALAEARDAAAFLAGRTAIDLTPEQVLESPHIFIGSLASLEAKFVRQREQLGINSIMVGEMGPLDAVVERLAGR